MNGIFVALSLLAIYLNFVAVIGLLIEPKPGFNTLQKVVQIIFILFFPLVGSTFVLYILTQQAPGLISKRFIPWPLRILIWGKKLRSDSDRSHDEQQPGIHSGNLDRSIEVDSIDGQ